ncbi:acyltransferase domain-containing protein [Nonomuraea sp. NBC_01738]|uniref:acyltransferase domain-containing protein n=1 Tax=Nonomuraea sp. NBC_01738 TaxID=2976003 RepID=UPI002E0E181B|nr:acyltransferase domain-containing protein [Nonomuraea sp. NBC_01738]
MDILREHPEWHAYLRGLGGLDVSFPDDPLTGLLRLAVPHEDIAGVLASLPTPGDERWWLLERCVHSLVATMGDTDDPMWFPDLPEAGPYFYIHVFLAALPYTLAYHRERGIPPEVSALTLTDLGRNMAVHRKRHGTPGLHAPFWFMLHARGVLYQLGRLQFARVRLGRTTGEGVLAGGGPSGPGDAALGVHIPDFSGPMGQEACTDSFERARAFFPRHFPEEKPLVVTCASWLLDDQFAQYLPAASNIMRFQRRFHLLHRFEGSGMMDFVFGADAARDPLPRRTRLETAIATHLDAGGTWHGRLGWAPLG